MTGGTVYMLRCADGSYYVGSTRASLDRRIAEHDAGSYGGYTASRRPVALVWHQELGVITDAIAVERRIKGWSRAKKAALISGDWSRVRALGLRSARRSPSFETPRSAAPQDEERNEERRVP